MYRRVTPYARKRTHFTSRKEQREIPVNWSDSTNRQLYVYSGGEAYGSVIKLTFRHHGRPGDCQITNNNNNIIWNNTPLTGLDGDVLSGWGWCSSDVFPQRRRWPPGQQDGDVDLRRDSQGPDHGGDTVCQGLEPHHQSLQEGLCWCTKLLHPGCEFFSLSMLAIRLSPLLSAYISLYFTLKPMDSFGTWRKWK